ncbi:unnamed protein product, partial [Phaeothamnion confervicola]
MAERGMQVKADLNKSGWEDADFPIVCETCLGSNPYVRMTKEPYGMACKICERPFTIFRWRPGAEARFKKTEVCQTCAKLKNVCQTCVLDLQYGLPVEVRDKFLAEEERVVVPESDTQREWMAQQHTALVAQSDGSLSQVTVHSGDSGGVGGAGNGAHEKLLRLARNAPYYKRNLAHLCSFFAKGECNRGSKCPFRHEMPHAKDDPLNNQNIKDRFYGHDDPVAAKKFANMAKWEDRDIKPPDDETVTTLWVGGMDAPRAKVANIDERDLRDAFYSFGELRGVRMLQKSGCAFVEFTERAAAERAAAAHWRGLSVKGVTLQVNWSLQGGNGGGGQESLTGPSGVGRAEAAAVAVPAAADPFKLPPPPGFQPGQHVPGPGPNLRPYNPPSSAMQQPQYGGYPGYPYGPGASPRGPPPLGGIPGPPPPGYG